MFIPKNIRNMMPMLHAETGLDSIQVPLDRVVKVPYVADGPKELWDVCQPPGLIESRIVAIESEEEYDRDGAMDCDDYARYLANSIESQHSPLLFSVLCIKKSEMKWGIIPQLPGHMVCLWTDNIINENASGKIYHIGNWNQIRNSTTGEIIGSKDSRHYAYNSLLDMAQDLTRSMAGDDGEILAWIIMDQNLRVCKWGMGASSDLSDLNYIELQRVRPISLIG